MQPRSRGRRAQPELRRGSGDLVALQRYHALVEENPEEWLPWNYAETLVALGLEA